MSLAAPVAALVVILGWPLSSMGLLSGALSGGWRFLDARFRCPLLVLRSRGGICGWARALRRLRLVGPVLRCVVRLWCSMGHLLCRRLLDFMALAYFGGARLVAIVLIAQRLLLLDLSGIPVP